ncbi:hypothetical protein Tco_0586335 [Tanacetum coccineum]
MKSRKRRFRQDTSQDDQTNNEKENDELRLCLTIATNEDKEVDYEILDKKYPIIEWKTEYLGSKPQEDINDVYQLVMDKYQDEIPEGFDIVIWGDLIIMFNPYDEDEFWNSPQDWNVVSWKLHGSSGVHTLMTETPIYLFQFLLRQQAHFSSISNLDELLNLPIKRSTTSSHKKVARHFLPYKEPKGGCHEASMGTIIVGNSTKHKYSSQLPVQSKATSPQHVF